MDTEPSLTGEVRIRKRPTFATVMLSALALFGGRVEGDSSRTRAPRVDRVLVSFLREGVFLYDLKGQVLWSHACEAYDAAEFGPGRVLITNRAAGRVFAVSRDG